jgi:hypothetical protein
VKSRAGAKSYRSNCCFHSERHAPEFFLCQGCSDSSPTHKEHHGEQGSNRRRDCGRIP